MDAVGMLDPQTSNRLAILKALLKLQLTVLDLLLAKDAEPTMIKLNFQNYLEMPELFNSFPNYNTMIQLINQLLIPDLNQFVLQWARLLRIFLAVEFLDLITAPAPDFGRQKDADLFSCL